MTGFCDKACICWCRRQQGVVFEMNAPELNFERIKRDQEGSGGSGAEEPNRLKRTETGNGNLD